MRCKQHHGHRFKNHNKLFWYGAVFGAITAISRAAVSDELLVLDTHGTMSLVVQDTHYMPKRWWEKESTKQVFGHVTHGKMLFGGNVFHLFNYQSWLMFKALVMFAALVLAISKNTVTSITHHHITPPVKVPRVNWRNHS